MALIFHLSKGNNNLSLWKQAFYVKTNITCFYSIDAECEENVFQNAEAAEQML